MNGSASGYDVLIRGGTVVTEEGQQRVNIAVRNGLIEALTMEEPPAAQVIDASELLVLPGGIDAHTHLNSVWPFPDERRPADDFESGTRGAAAGGITTVCDFVYPLGEESLVEAIERVRADAAAKSHIDFAFHVVVTNFRESYLDEVAGVIDAGYPSFKFYTPNPDFTAKGAQYLRLMRAIGERQGVAMFHCEDRAIIEFGRSALLGSGRVAPRFYPDSKPVAAEISATAQAISMAAVAGVSSYIVHLSSAGALDQALAARAGGARVFVETRPLYLYLTAERFQADDPVAARYIGTPPLRTSGDLERLWTALAMGDIDVVASDHVGFTKAQKYRPGDTFDTVPKGVANLETLMPMLYSEGVGRGRLTLERFVQVISTTPARIFGLYPRKGTIAPGSDADLCLFDPLQRRRLSGELMQSAADLELFEGMTVTGWPAYTISRGKVIYDHGRVIAQPGRGRLVPGQLPQRRPA